MSGTYRERLSASDMLQIRKVMEHVFEKCINPGSDSVSHNAHSDHNRSDMDPDDLAAAALEKVSIYCNNQVRLIDFSYRSLCTFLFAVVNAKSSTYQSQITDLRFIISTYILDEFPTII